MSLTFEEQQLQDINQKLEYIKKLKAQFQAQGQPEPEIPKVVSTVAPEWQTPSHREVDPFDPEYDLVANTREPEPGLIPSVKAAIEKGFHVFPLTPKDKHPLAGSAGFKDSKNPNDPLVLTPWNEDPTRNIGIDLGASDLCVLDFDKPESIPAWLNETKTYKVKSAKGVHIYFRGARKTTKLYVDGQVVGDVKSTGGYVLAAGSIHPDGPVYTVIDNSDIAPVPERVSELLRHDSERVNVSEDGPPIPYGSHDNELTRIAGVLRNASMNPQDIEEHLINVCERRCENYGSDYREMCKKIAKSIGKKPVGQASPMLLIGGVPPGTAQTQQPPQVSNWRNEFRTIGQMEQGDIEMLIDGFLPEGTTFLGALPAHGKTLVALSIVRALTTQRPLFGNPVFTVKEKHPVLYLIPETGDKAFRTRLEKFQIPNDEIFLCRTVSSGAPLALDSPLLLEAVRQHRPVVFLDTAIRFSKSEDENSAAANKKLVDDVIALRAAGAPAVVLLHHAKKDTGKRKSKMTLENMLRGTGDLGAMCDTAYGVRRDDSLYNNGGGPLEIEVANIKPRDLVNPPAPFRLAATYKKEDSIFPVSHINETGDFVIVNPEETEKRTVENLLRLVAANPDLKAKELAGMVQMTEYAVRRELKYHGWCSVQGGPDGSSPWHQHNGQPCPYEKPKRAARRAKPDVDLEPSKTIH
jgi:hypothetical protein